MRPWREGRARASTSVGVLVVLLAAVGGCGGETGDEATIGERIAELQQSFDAGDMDAACESLTRAAARHVGDIGHDAPTTCARDLSEIYGYVKEVGDPPAGPTPDVLGVKVAGDAAVATVRFGSGATGRVPLAREDGEWKVDALYGGVPARLQEDKF